MANITEIITVHAVIDEKMALLDVHCHGLEKYNHPNFAVFAPSIFIGSATKLLNSLADAVINKGKLFRAEETCDWDEWGKFTLTYGEDAGDLSVLRIVPIKPEGDAYGES